MKPGDTLGPYRILRELGTGASCRVFLAEEGDGSDGPRREVALKVFHQHLVHHADFVARFEREATAGRVVVNDNVVRVYDADFLVVDGEPRFFLVMEPVFGRSLRRVGSESGPLPEPLLRAIARETAHGLAAVHDAGLVHRDVKPDNLVLTDGGRVRLMDLGVARVLGAARTLTAAGDFVGTLLYAAPELLSGAPASPAADVYGLGVTLFELATGGNPFLRDSVAATAEAHRAHRPPALDALRPEISPHFAEVVAVALAKRPEARFADARALLRALEGSEAAAWFAARAERAAHARRGAGRPVVPHATALHGRAADLEALRLAWERARQGRGGTVRLDGEAGIGKSRLVDAFLDARPDGTLVLHAAYAPDGAGRGLVGSLAPLLPPAGPPLAERLGDLAPLGPALEAAVRGSAPTPETPRLPAGMLPALLARLLASVAAESPFVWVVEDVHFAPAEERTLVRRVAAEAASHAALVLVTSRPGAPDEAAAWAQVPCLERRGLARLAPPEVVRMLDDLLGSPSLAERLGPRVSVASDGVPFHVLEVVRALHDSGALARAPGGEWVLTRDVERLAAPPSLHDALRARLADLSPEERATLDVAAVLGFEFDPEVVAAVLEKRLVPVLQALAAVERRTGLVRSLPSTYRFDHHLVEEVLRRDLPPRLAGEYHALAAAALDARAGGGEADLVERCRHHLEGARPERARDLVMPALTRLNLDLRTDTLAELSARALAVPGLLAARDRFQVLFFAARAAHLLGRRTEVDRWTAENVALTASIGDPGLEAEAWIDRGRALSSLSRHEEALAAVERACVCMRAADAPASDVAVTEAFAAGMLQTLGRFDEARARIGVARSLLAGAPPAPDGYDEGVVHVGIAEARLLGALRRWDAAAAVFEATAAVAARGPNSSIGVVVGMLRASALQRAGRFADADAAAEAALAVARGRSMTVLESNLLVRRAAIAFDLGDTASALDTALLGESLARLVDNERTSVEGALLRARIALWRGDLPSARALLASAKTLSTGPDTEPVRDALERAALDVQGLGAPPRDALADLEASPIPIGAAEAAARSPARDLVPVELRALAGEAGADDLAAARDVERRTREQPSPGLAWRAVAVRALLGDASAVELDEARRELEARTGAADRVRVSYVAWRATGRESDREAALAALGGIRAGAPPVAADLPFLAELRGSPS